ncbi:MAG: SusC/RagA family TonB-linked outer membrane protein [Alistipes sp.]|nr:SusC/RagA family TonB-linked outer membrane protein [Alistipes sp.]
MRKKQLLILAFLVCLSLPGLAQDDNNVTGYVVDRWGKPVSGALITSATDPGLSVATDRDGKFTLTAAQDEKLRVTTSSQGYKIFEADTSQPMRIVMDLGSQGVNIGYEITQNLGETASSVYVADGEEFDKFSARDIGSAMFGNVLGLTALQGSGTYTDYQNTFYVRGLQTLTLNDNSPLILVDGIERDLYYITPEEVEQVVVLKDAAAVALYGYKGANGAINIVTKRGKYETREIKFSYDHAFNWQVRRPKLADSYTYASAMNEALANDGQTPRYSQAELDAFQSGNYPYLYPNVNWIDETFKTTGGTDIFNLSFRGGGKSFRYYTLLNLDNNKGFVKTPKANDGYSTQDMYSKANLRTNLDIDLGPSTKMELNLLGTLQEMRRPGDSADIWGDMIYAVPSAAFPIQTEDGLWGGNSTWAGTLNPVAQSQAAGYTKSHRRALFADMTLRQDLSVITPGLGGSFRLAYDNSAIYIENYSKTYIYGSDAVTSWNGSTPDLSSLSRYTGGADSELNDSSDLDDWARAFNFDIALYYSRTFGRHKLYSQFKWDYEYHNIRGVDNTWCRQNLSLYTHYGFKERYIVDLALVASAANKLAPDSRWGFSPTVSAAWVLTKEEFMNGSSWADMIKLRASWGLINRDNIPAENYWKQVYSALGNASYPIDSGYGIGTDLSGWSIGRLGAVNPTHEKALKYNLGLDASLFKGSLNVVLEGFCQKRKDIWVESSEVYSEALGFDPPYKNAGRVDSWGFEAGIDYIKKVGDFTFNVGGTFTLNKNEIKEQLEMPKAYDNLVSTGLPVGQIFGYIAEGFFKDDADIANSPTQWFGNVRPGDIKYRDVNGDGKIDEDDLTAIGYNTLVPEIYYSFKLGAEWKGFGFNALFQGAGNYSAILNTSSVYWPLINNTTISDHYYNNRWAASNTDAKYPALSSQSSNNNYQTNTIWLQDRSFLKLRYVELYYNFPKGMLSKTSFMHNAKLYVRGVDLACFDKIKIADPESYGATSPLTRSLVIGLAVGF